MLRMTNRGWAKWPARVGRRGSCVTDSVAEPGTRGAGSWDAFVACTRCPPPGPPCTRPQSLSLLYKAPTLGSFLLCRHAPPDASLPPPLSFPSPSEAVPCDSSSKVTANPYEDENRARWGQSLQGLHLERHQPWLCYLRRVTSEVGTSTGTEGKVAEARPSVAFEIPRQPLALPGERQVAAHRARMAKKWHLYVISLSHTHDEAEELLCPLTLCPVPTQRSSERSVPGSTFQRLAVEKKPTYLPSPVLSKALEAGRLQNNRASISPNGKRRKNHWFTEVA